MDKRALQSYAVWAKTNLENQIEVQLKTLGINSERDIKTARVVGDRTIIDGDMNSYPADLKNKRDSIVRIVQEDGYKQVIEEFAYTWFNRIVALRFMEVHDFLPHGFRVLSSRTGGFEPEIMKNLNFVKDELKLDLSVIAPLMEQGKIDEAYRYVLFRQCNALSGILPMLFSSEQSYLELLLPKALLKGETFITKLLEIGEDDFLNDIEVIGWLYQFYISQKKDEVFASKATITKDTLPAVTQLFTPDWIVRYMAENSVGRIWLESYPNSALKGDMKYYVEDAEQEAEVQRKLDEVKYKNVNPEDIKIIEPCCGSGHILVYVFDLLYKMYEEKGYPAREIPTLILKKNLTGLDVDKRAAQLASFSLVMKARSLNSRFFNATYYTSPNVTDIWDARILLKENYESQLNDLKLLSSEEIKNIKWLVEKYRYGKTIGSLLKVEKRNFASIQASIEKIKNQSVITIFNSVFLNEGIQCLEHLLNQAILMSNKYDVLITNPPYLGLANLEVSTKNYANENYPDSKADMYSMFMDTKYVKNNGFTAIINMHSWMFLASFEKIRTRLIKTTTFTSILHLGAHAFDSIGGEVVQTVAFIERNIFIDKYISTAFRLVDVSNAESKKQKMLDMNANKGYVLKALCECRYIPGSTLTYWMSEKMISLFKNSNKLSEFYFPGGRNKTHDNEKYVREWWEISDLKKWQPYAKGGSFRKWYGNINEVVNWSPEAKREYDRHGGLYNQAYANKNGICWSLITSGPNSFRIKQTFEHYDSGSPTIFENNFIFEENVLGYLNSKVASKILSFINPTLNMGNTYVLSLPYKNDHSETIKTLVGECIAISKNDWDSSETSMDFRRCPAIKRGLLSELFENWLKQMETDFKRLKENEEYINKYFVEKYGLNDEISWNVSDEEISFKSRDKVSGIKEIISFLVGVEMGRYSLDVEGLTYAGGDWNPMNYVTYQPDDDGIVPVYPQLGMADGLTARIIKLIKHIYGEDTYKENIDFIADALGKKSSESSEETLNRYLNEGFYADHLKTYQKRPIYWMFSSGKNDAFKCLVYLHRYNEDTLARINSKYFLNESARLNAEVNDTAAQLEAADGREKLRLDKLYKTLSAKQKEMLEYGWVLDHMANQYIPLDLDDGVKVNYAKFQGIEIVNDNGAKVKKDLLVPIK